MGDEYYIKLLNERHQWPGEFIFKFIVPAERGKELEALFPEMKFSFRPSRGGKYLAYTFQGRLESAEEVLRCYARARTVDGIICL